MVVKHGQDVESNSKGNPDSSVEHDNANSSTTSVFISDTRAAVKLRRAEFNNFSNDIGSKRFTNSESQYLTPKYSEERQTSHRVPAYANISYFSSNNEGNTMTDQDRPTVVVRRTGSFDSTEGKNSPRNSMKNEGEYECMSSPDSFSNSSSNRSSNASSFYGNISPDTISLASFSGRLNFGRFSTCSKRSSQSSNASSQDSGRQSWDKIRDSFDLSDGVISSTRRPSGEHIYENTRPLTPDNFMRFSRVEGNMEVIDQADDLPPPLPTRQQQHPVSFPTKEEPEMILPYKVVDLDELQRSLEGIEPYYVHNGSEDVDNNFFNNKPDSIKMGFNKNGESAESSDFRPVLPPKKRPLSHSQSDTTFNATEFKERPTPLPRQSLICDLTQAYDSTVQDTQTDESTNLTEQSMSNRGHISRRKSPSSGPGSKLRQNSTSPQRNARPMRSAPPPPPLRSQSTGERVSSDRPVSEMFPRNRSNNSPAALKRSLTVSLPQSLFNRRPVNSFCEGKSDNENPVQNSSIPQKLSSGEQYDEKNRENTKKALKTGAFFKKALGNLKIPGTKKAAKKELTISPPSDFTSMCETRLTTDFSNRGQKTVSFLARDDNCAELADSEVSTVMCEFATEEAKPNNEECELTTESPDEPMEQLSFHPEFTEFPVLDVDEPCEQIYYNFPVSQTVGNGTEKLSIPKKPPRSGYLQPSLSQLTKEREEEISFNKLPELGPLPRSPEGPIFQETSNESPVGTPESNAATSSTFNKMSDFTTSEDHIYSVTEDQDSEDQKENDARSDKPLRKPKPEVPRRPSTLKFKPKVPNRPVFQSSDKPTPIPRSLTLDSATIQKSRKESVRRNNLRPQSASLEESAEISRSCDSLHHDAPTDNYVADMHLVVLKDILRCWRNMLRKPTISLDGACWEDFEIIESESRPEVSEYQDSVSLQVRLRKESTNLDLNNRCGQYIAKIKRKSQGNKNTKSSFDQDYSVSTSLEPHENISRVLAYFRGEIQSSILGMKDDTSPLHTTISISDQVPMQTCAEFIVQSKDADSDVTSYEKVVCMLMIQCLKGVMHLHDSGFAHGNLNLSNLFLIKHNRDFQLLIGNFGKSQPLPKERRASALYSKVDGSPLELRSDQSDFLAISEIFTTMLQDQNGTRASKSSCSAFSKHLRRASEKLRDGSVSTHQVICFLQALLWGPFKHGENILIVSESRTSQWLNQQRSEFIARLAMDEALARTVGEHSRKFSMEDLLLCEYLAVATPSSLARTDRLFKFIF